MAECRVGRAGWLMATSATLVFAATGALAGPPFTTDDPQPTDYKQFEIYLYSEGTHSAGNTTGTLPGIEINYGAAPNLQVSIAIPLAYDRGENHGARMSYGATEIGVKYRFIEEDETGWQPQVSFYPSAEIPIGDSDRPAGIGGGHTRFFLPLWTQKSFGQGQHSAAEAIGSIPARATKTIGSPAGPCSGRSRRTSHWASKPFIKAMILSAAKIAPA